MISLLNRAFWLVAAVAYVVTGAVFYQQWPPPPVKVCASVELGELMAAAKKAEAQLHDSRAQLLALPGEASTKEVMRMEAVSAQALIAVAKFKEQEQARQKASGAAARAKSCS